MKFTFNKNVFFDVMSAVTFIYSSFMGFIIYTHLDVNGGLFNQSVNFVSFNKAVDNFFFNFFRFNFSGDKEEVDNSLYYLEVDEHTFTSEDGQIKMLGEGYINYKAIGEGSTYAVVVTYNTVVATYFDVINPLVNSGDHLLKGETLGTYEDCFKVYFQQDQKDITYSEALTKI